MDLPSIIQWKQTVDNLMTQDKKSIEEFLCKFENNERRLKNSQNCHFKTELCSH